MSDRIEKAFDLAVEQYAEMGVDVEAALAALSTIPVSMHCWQGDDVGGFENSGASLDGGLAATGNYPGKARTPEELRSDLDAALGVIPGTHRLNLHSIYAETDGVKVDRAELDASHFARWIDWAASKNMGLDFNGSFFSHPKAADGFTLSHADAAIRDYWIAHAKACRRIAGTMAARLGKDSVVNVWVPDGFKDTPIDRQSPRMRLAESLDTIFAEDEAGVIDAVECKLFGIGSESCVIGSHEFYMGYAISRQTALCLDAGHFHPTEVISDKLSSVLLYVPHVLLHVSRGVRWDSDHVVTYSDELRAIAEELVRNDLLSRVSIGLDYFDASINRVAAWVIGTRNMIKALLAAMLEPIGQLRDAERTGDFTRRLALLEERPTLPLGAVWDMYCQRQGVPVGQAWLDEVKRYERDVLSLR